MYLCVGLGGWAAQTVISRGFYALASMWLPTTVGTIIAVASWCRSMWYCGQNFGAIGLAVASSVCDPDLRVRPGLAATPSVSARGCGKGGQPRRCAGHSRWGTTIG